MTEEYPIIPIDNPEQSAWGISGRSLGEYNRQQAGPDNARRICYVVQTPAGEIAGGVIAVTYWDWLFIDLMWLREDLRGHGYGGRLLALAEEAGRRYGATHAHLASRRPTSTPNTATESSANCPTSRPATGATI